MIWICEKLGKFTEILRISVQPSRKLLLDLGNVHNRTKKLSHINFNANDLELKYY